jgi:uncharacterized radical SAM superfamily Fe-S cluster-containing enzyme
MPVSLDVLGSPAAAPALSQRLEAIRATLLRQDEGACVAHFDLGDFDRLLKTTVSLCPECLRHVEAIVFVRGTSVLMKKRCREHGFSEALVESDVAFYRLSNKDRWGRRFAPSNDVVEFPAYAGSCCGDGCCDPSAGDDSGGNFTDQWANKSCTVLVEVTNACNLACPVCYSDARGDRKMPLEVFKQYMLEMVRRKGGLDSVQLTGGEAALHPEFWEMVAFLHGLDGVKRIYLPTNGILFAAERNARRLLPFKDKLMVLLQFDGEGLAANRALRDANPVRVRDQVVEHLQSLGVCMQLTMTISAGVNDDEVGWVVDTGMRHRAIKLVALQPATYSGRYGLPPDPLHRATLSGVVKAVVRQARARVSDDQFVPIPCSHPNCGWLTLFVRRFGLRVNVIKHIDLPRVMNDVAYKTVLSTDQFRGIVGTAGGLARGIAGRVGRKLVRAGDVFGVAVKPFMDRFTYDQDRISACCHHLMDTHGQPVSFCEYNARLRPSDSWDRWPRLSNPATGSAGAAGGRRAPPVSPRPT